MNQDTQTNDRQTLSTLSTHNQTVNFWLIWIKHEEELRHKCHTLMNNHHTDAEDALKSAMVKANKVWPKVATQLKNPRAWLFRLTINHCIDLHRSSKYQAIASDNLETYNVSSITTTSPKKTPFQQLLQDELYQVLKLEIQNLPDAQRETFVSYYLHQKSTQDIATQLGISEDSVYKRNQKAREHLRHRLNLYLHSDRYQPKTSRKPVHALKPILDSSVTSRTTTYRISLPCLTLQPQLWSQSSIQLECR